MFRRVWSQTALPAILCCQPSTSSVFQRACCSTTTGTSSAKTGGSPDDDEDDFVLPPPLGKTAREGSRGDRSAVLDPSRGEEILGVTREKGLDGTEEFSRFHLPLEVPRGGKAPPRESSRSCLQVEPSVEDLFAFETTEQSVESELSTKQALPYDDEYMAEKMLEMEVSGMIDECWQDRGKAHFEDVKEIVEIMKQMKVKDVCVISTSEKTSNFDYMVSGTCEGPRHIHIASWAVQEADKYHSMTKVKRQKADETWECLPIGRILVNLMTEEFREETNFERKWAVCSNMDPLNAARSPVSESRQIKAHGLWTLTLNMQDLQDFEVDYCKDELLGQR